MCFPEVSHLLRSTLGDKRTGFCVLLSEMGWQEVDREALGRSGNRMGSVLTGRPGPVSIQAGQGDTIV